MRRALFLLQIGLDGFDYFKVGRKPRHRVEFGVGEPLHRLVLDELATSSELARLALESLAARKGGAFDAAAWNDGLRRVIGRHRDLWLARNRAGGLRESMNVLEGFLKKDIR